MSVVWELNEKNKKLSEENEMLKAQLSRAESEIASGRRRSAEPTVNEICDDSRRLGLIAGEGVKEEASRDVKARLFGPIKFDAEKLAAFQYQAFLEDHGETKPIQAYCTGVFEASYGDMDGWNEATKLAAMHSMFFILSEFLGFANSKWTSPLMMMYMFVLLSMTKCPTFGTVCAGLFAGKVVIIAYPSLKATIRV